MKLYSVKNQDGSFEFQMTSTPKSGYELVPEQYTLSDVPYLSVTEQIQIINNIPTTVRVYNLDVNAKQVAEGLKTKELAVTNAYNQMNSEVYAQMASVFRTTKPDSATVFYETWKDMVANPSNYHTLGLKVDHQLMNPDNTELFDEGAALDTPAKVTAFASRKIEQALAYGVWRMQRIQQFKTEREQILAQ